MSTKAEPKPKSQQLQWRRSKEVRSRGLSQIEIARELQVSEASISSDVQYLREQAKGTIKEYVTDHLPEQYQVCLSALYTILKHACMILLEVDVITNRIDTFHHILSLMCSNISTREFATIVEIRCLVKGQRISKHILYFILIVRS